jgi:hypothetical protein
VLKGGLLGDSLPSDHLQIFGLLILATKKTKKNIVWIWWTQIMTCTIDTQDNDTMLPLGVKAMVYRLLNLGMLQSGLVRFVAEAKPQTSLRSGLGYFHPQTPDQTANLKYHP